MLPVVSSGRQVRQFVVTWLCVRLRRSQQAVRLLGRLDVATIFRADNLRFVVFTRSVDRGIVALIRHPVHDLTVDVLHERLLMVSDVDYLASAIRRTIILDLARGISRKWKRLLRCREWLGCILRGEQVAGRGVAMSAHVILVGHDLRRKFHALLAINHSQFRVLLGFGGELRFRCLHHLARASRPGRVQVVGRRTQPRFSGEGLNLMLARR